VWNMAKICREYEVHDMSGEKVMKRLLNISCTDTLQTIKIAKSTTIIKCAL
jgi:hypothetical protein